MINRDKLFIWFFYLSVVAVLLLLALQKVHDTDVWLHLGIGKYIVEHRALPAGDIFTYPSYGKPYEYYEWLFQAGLYWLYRYFSYDGLMVFKLVLWLLTLGLLWQWMKDEGVESRWAAFFTLFPAYWLAMRWRERPEVVGYFFLALYLVVLSQYRRGRNYFYFLPWVQIIWMNIHASALLGMVVYLIILLGEGVDYFWRKDKDRGDLRVIRGLAVMVPVLLAVSFINPYGYKLVIHPFIYSTQMAQNKIVQEWVSLWTFKEFHHIYLAFLLPVILFFVLRLLIVDKKFKISDSLLLILGGLLPYVSARYLTVFAILSLPLAGKSFYELFNQEKVGQSLMAKRWQKIAGWRWSSLALVLIMGGVLFTFSIKKAVLGWGGDRYAVPQQAMAFIQQEHLPGRVFNWYEWGGYMILEAYPYYLAYTDSRAFDFEVFQEYRHIISAEAGWEQKLESRNINLILTRSMSFTDGALFPLVIQLLQSPQWVLIWDKDATLVFLRNSAQNQLWGQRFALSKTRVYREIIEEGKYLTDHRGIIKNTYESMGWAYMMQGNFKKAEEAYKQHLKINPKDEAVKDYFNFMTQGKF